MKISFSFKKNTVFLSMLAMLLFCLLMPASSSGESFSSKINKFQVVISQRWEEFKQILSQKILFQIVRQILNNIFAIFRKVTIPSVSPGISPSPSPTPISVPKLTPMPTPSRHPQTPTPIPIHTPIPTANPTPTPTPTPIVDAGSDKTVIENQSVFLDGSGFNPDGDTLSYLWSCDGGTLMNAAAAVAIFNSPSVDTDTRFSCTLSVIDDKGLSSRDSVIIIVKDEVPTVFNLSVLLIGYNPVEDGKNLAETYYAWQMGGRTAEKTEDYIANETIMAFNELSGNTINYTVAKKIQIDHFTPYTNGFNYNFASFYNCANGDPGLVCETQKHYFDYISWVRENRICEIAEENNIDEIWVISAPFVMTWENFMIGPDAGFGVNGPDYTIPECKKHYIAVNGTYERPEAVLHVYGHRIEATMSHLTSYWSRTDYQSYWENFSTISRYGQPCNDQSGLYSGLTCGNAHFPANGVCHYDVDNLENIDFNCKDWKNFPNFTGEKENINCSVWDCSDIGWQKYWFSSLPRGSGDVEMMSTTNKKFFFKKNWWYYLLFPDNVISLVQEMR